MERAKPLTKLLQKNAFAWNDEAEGAFHKLKEAMVKGPVLTLPDFSQPFVDKCDASGTGLEAVLMQAGWPIAYYS